MRVFLLTVFLFTLLLVGINCFDSFRHRHRHSRGHPQEYNFDRLVNSLDSTSTLQVPETTSKKPQKDIDDFSESVTEANTDPKNSLWGEDSPDSTTSRYPLNSKRWEDLLKGVKVDKDKHREVKEDAEDTADDESEEDEGDEQQDRPGERKPGETYSNWKWNNMGNRNAVNSLFEVYRSGFLKPGSKEAEDKQQAYLHAKRMSKETLCRWPKPMVVRVSDFYGSSSKLYVPACTVLHRCSDDTGCCGLNQRCEAKTTKRVELDFYTKYIVSTSSSQHATQQVEKLPFYNHTECQCVNRLEDAMPRDENPSVDLRNERSSEQGCKCPSEYTERRLANGSCLCDCFDKQRDCIKYKRGKEYFNYNDRLCIEMGTCQQPLCDFGMYLRNSGRCPRKHEKFRSWSRHHHSTQL